MWPTPKEWDTDGGQFGHLAVEGTHVDGKVWIKNSDGPTSTGSISRPISGKISARFKGSAQRQADRNLRTPLRRAENDVYLLDFSAGNVAKIDSKTKQLSVFLTPTPAHARGAGASMTKAGSGSPNIRASASACSIRRRQMKEWKVPTPGARLMTPCCRERRGLDRLDADRPRVAARHQERQSPNTCCRARPISAASTWTTRSVPGTLWIGSNHGGSIVKVEPLE